MPLDQYVVVVSRKWRHPEIHVRVDDVGLMSGIALDDFLHALAAEMGNPETLSGINAAAQRVVAEMKEAVSTAWNS